MTPSSKVAAMDVWWVNQGRTYAHESVGGYFWAPLQGRGGRTPRHWQRMAEVKRGDIVLHYVGGHILAVGRVEKDAYQALYPRVDHDEYGGRDGFLVETSYYPLAKPIARDEAARLGSLPASGGPFSSAGAVIQGYLFAFGVDALKELVNKTSIHWPQWVRDFVEGGQPPDTLDQRPQLRQFLKKLQNMNVAVVDGQPMKYKPLMVLAAMRTLLDGARVRFGPPLLDYYNEFCVAIGVDPSRPNQPYYHLTSDGLWRIYNDDETVFDSKGTPTPNSLRATSVRLPEGREDDIRNPTWRPLILAALRDHFDGAQWRHLTTVWPEMATAGFIAGNVRVQSTLTPEDIREGFYEASRHFAEALSNSHLRFGPDHDDFVRRFVASLATKPFVILTGLSGSGKTQIAQQFGHWVGGDQLLVVPVRPDWTGSDALFGYEDALQPAAEDGRRAWYVPEALRFMLRAARDPDRPYVLVLDEMNLAHVERYFADVLSGMESGQPTLPNLDKGADGYWRPLPGRPGTIPVPNNLFIIGTVNVDETTYMFSPKVLDRANTIEFRVATDDLKIHASKPTRCDPGPDTLVRAFLAVATDAAFHQRQPHPGQEAIGAHLRRLHAALYEAGFEFGHRIFWESLRFAAMFASAGDADPNKALDAIVLQKIMPRLHGNRRHLEPLLATLGHYCYVLPDPEDDWDVDGTRRFDPVNPASSVDGPRLPGSFAKIQRMTRRVRAHQFASFAE